MSIGILCSGFIVHATQGFPGFEPIAVVGGMFWAIGSVLNCNFKNDFGFKQMLCHKELLAVWDLLLDFCYGMQQIALLGGLLDASDCLV